LFARVSCPGLRFEIILSLSKWCSFFFFLIKQ
jgi:hypothetical protein